MNRPSPKALRVLVVDDEALARQRLIDLLTKAPGGVEIIEAGDGSTAVDIIDAQSPDIVFLDIQMPGLNGLDVVQAVGTDRMPLTVFVTAYNQHAVRAFEANALDYLLKPFSDERFEVTMERAHARLEQASLRNFSRQLVKLVAGEARAEPWDRLVIKSGGATRFVKTADIDLIEAAGVYVNLHVAGKQVLYRAPLHVLAEKLDPVRFVRVHRSAIVNIESIVQLDPMSHGEYEVALKLGARTKVSRSYRGNLERRLGQAL